MRAAAVAVAAACAVGLAASIEVEIGVGHGRTAALVFDSASDLHTLAESFVVEHRLRRGEGCDSGSAEAQSRLDQLTPS